MTLKDFDQYFADLCVEEVDLLRRKGQEYSGKEDRHSNFKRLAVQLNMKPEAVLWVYLTKHLDSLASYIRGDYTGIEPIRGRIMDARNYLALLAAMIEDGAT
jgi:hypothetical protein